MGHERFAVVFADVAVGGNAGFRAQEAGELAALIIFDDDDPLAAAQKTRDLFAVEGDDPANGDLVRDDALLGGKLLDGLPDDAFGGPPANEGDLGGFRP